MKIPNLKGKALALISIAILCLPLISSAQVIIPTGGDAATGGTIVNSGDTNGADTTFAPSGSLLGETRLSSPGANQSQQNPAAPGASQDRQSPGAGGAVQDQQNPGADGANRNIPGRGFFYLQNPLNSRFNSVGGLVQGFLEIFSYVVVLFGVLMLIWVGLKFVLAQGNPEEMNKLKSWLLWIVVGVAIVIGARIIVSIVINTLSATGAVSPGVIQNTTEALRSVSPTR